MTLDAFIAGLTRGGLDLDVENVLDALWLAQQPRALVIDFAIAEHDAGDPETSREPSKHRTKRKKPPPAPLPQPENRSLADESAANSAQVFAENVGEDAHKTHRASPVSIPAAQALPGRLALARSLRPFLQRWRSHRDLDINEELTVERTAELDRYLYPVFRPRLERWFDASVVIEDEPAVAVWSDTLRDFCQTLRETGAFQDVRLWRLRFPKARSATHAAAATDGSPEPYLETPAGGKVSTQVLTGGTRRLIFFATHGSSSRWFDGSYARVLASWTGKCSVVLLHLLPRDLWKRTPLGYPNAFCNTREPGVPTARLNVDRPWWTLADEEQSADLVIPCIPLNPTGMAEWSAMQMARGRRSSAYVLSVNPGQQEAPSIAKNDPDYFERVLSIFRSDFPQASRLATYLASGPFTLPVARLVQEAKFGPAADQSTLAEVLLSGLVTARFAGEGSLDDNSIYYDFHPQARKILLRSLRRADAELIAGELERRVSEYIEQIHGRQVSFRALVRDSRGKYDLPDWAQPFALLGTSLLGIKSPQTISPLELVERFVVANAPGVVRAAARLAKSRQEGTFDRRSIPADLRPVLVQGQIIQGDADLGWDFVPGVSELVSQRLLRGIRILWVDDVPANNAGESKYLGNLGADIGIALNTRQAMASLRDGTFDLVLSDMYRGENEREGGLELLRQMRNTECLQPVIIYANRWAQTGRRRAMDAGAFGCTNQAKELFDLVLRAAAILDATRNAKDGKSAIAINPSPQVDAEALFKSVQNVMRLAAINQSTRRIAWSPDGHYIAAADYDGTVQIWPAQDSWLLNSLEGHTRVVYGVCWSPDGERLASGSGDGSVRVWNFHSGVAERVIRSGNDSVLGVAWSPTGDHIASCTNDGLVLVYRADSGEPVVQSATHKGPAHTVAWSPDGRYLASGGNDGNVKILDMSSPRMEEDGFFDDGQVYGVAWSPDGSMLASCGSTRSVKLWRHHRRLITELLGHENNVTDISFSADGKYLASISWDNTVRVWSVRGHNLLATLAAPSAQRFHAGIAFHPFAGYGLAFITDKATAIEIWVPEAASEIPFDSKAEPSIAASSGNGGAAGESLQASAALIELLDSIGIDAQETGKLFANSEELGKRVLDLALEQGSAFENHLRVMQAFADSDRSELLLLSDEKLVVVAEVMDVGKPNYSYDPAHRERILNDAEKTRQAIFVTIGFPRGKLTETREWLTPESAAQLAIPLIVDENRPAVGVVNLEFSSRSIFSEPGKRWLIEFCKPLAKRIADKAPVVLINGVQKDHPIFARLISDLEQAGLIPWMATGRLGPEAWAQLAIQAAIRNSGWVLFILSQQSLRSYWATPAKSRGSVWGGAVTTLLQSLSNLNIVAAMIEECSVPLGLSLSPTFRLHSDYKKGIASLLLRLRTTQPSDAQSSVKTQAEKDPSQVREAEALRRPWHPPKDLERRGPLTPCSFSIHTRYLAAGAQRWKKWADVLVALDNPPNRDYVYLLPSRFAPERIHDPGSLGRDNSAVDLKRTLTSEFVKARVGTKLGGLMFTKTMGSGAKAIHVYSPDYDDFLSGRHYHAEAVAISGEMQTVVQPGPSITLPPPGGSLSDQANTYKFRDLISFSSAQTNVAGAATIAARRTTATSVVENLNILGVLTADRIVAQISIEYPRGGKGEPAITLLGTSFVNVRIAGSPIEIALDTQVFESGTIKEQSMKSAGQSYSANQAPFQHPLVTSLGGTFAGDATGNVLNIPEVGKVTLGELSIVGISHQLTPAMTRESYQLTMIRFEGASGVDVAASIAIAKVAVLSPEVSTDGRQVRQPTGKQPAKPSKVTPTRSKSKK